MQLILLLVLTISTLVGCQDTQIKSFRTPSNNNVASNCALQADSKDCQKQEEKDYGLPEDYEFIFTADEYRSIEGKLYQQGCSLTYAKGIVDCPPLQSFEAADQLWELVKKFGLGVHNDPNRKDSLVRFDALNLSYHRLIIQIEASEYMQPKLSEYESLVDEISSEELRVDAVVDVGLQKKIPAILEIQKFLDNLGGAELLQARKIKSLLIANGNLYSTTEQPGSCFVYLDYRITSSQIVDFINSLSPICQ